MSNIDLQRDTFTRLNKDGTVKTSKSGAIVQRGIIGVHLSGNKQERTDAARIAFTNAYANGQFKTIALEVSRVFGKQLVALAAGIKLDLSTGKVAPDARIGNREAWEMIFDAIRTAHATKEFKGERLALVGIINDAQAFFAIKRQEMADAAAADKARADAGIIEAETSEVQPAALPAPSAEGTETATSGTEAAAVTADPTAA